MLLGSFVEHYDLLDNPEPQSVDPAPKRARSARMDSPRPVPIDSGPSGTRGRPIDSPHSSPTNGIASRGSPITSDFRDYHDAEDCIPTRMNGIPTLITTKFKTFDTIQSEMVPPSPENRKWKDEARHSLYGVSGGNTTKKR